MIVPDTTSQKTFSESAHSDETKKLHFWHQVTLGAILLISLILNVFQLTQEGYANTYYAAAIKSMIQNWHNFFFVSFDPGGFVTIDKPPVGFWIQAASAKIFGFSGLSILLPEAIAGVLAVLLLFHLVRRTFGPVAGLIAALALAISPVSIVTNRNNTIDSLLVLTLLLGVWTLSIATEKGRLRWLLLTAVIVGVGFNIKMLQAYLVVPAFGLMYLLGAPISWKKRILHLLLATIILLFISFSWITVVDLIPASQRPYVGSSQTNSELELALGYNGIERLLGIHFGSITSSTSSAASTNAPGGVGGASENGAVGPLRLFDTELGGQISWLLPLALLAMLAVAWQERVRLPLNRRQQSLVLWGMWLITMVVFFSVAGFFHKYYLTMLAPAICALVGIGIVTMWNDYRRGSWRQWLLPTSLLITAGAQALVLTAYPDWSSWLTPIIVGFCLVVSAALVIGIVLPALRLDSRILVVVGMLALLLAPTVWSVVTVRQGSGGALPSAGPTATTSNGSFAGNFGGFPEGFPGGRLPEGFLGRGDFSRRDRPGGFTGSPGSVSTTDTKLISYLEAQQGSTKFLVAVPGSNSADSIILATGKAVMALGGFSGSDPILTLQQLQNLIKNGTIRYFLLQGSGGFGGFGGDQNGTLTQWISSTCTTVPASLWSSSSSSTTTGGQGFGGGQQLYDCAGKG
ncbi:MAG TPA: glycosyltransferase family 39 protein [Ktedonobacteraceae bacterium]|nr:glycosyltransferase family 39 protein [Ktedonobacteraceae bacterium]